MMELSEAYVTGLLADLEPLVPTLDNELKQAGQLAQKIDNELTLLLTRMDEAKQGLSHYQRRIEDRSQALSENNNQIANLHQELAALTARAEDFMNEMKNLGKGEVYLRVRRERAKVLVQIEDCNIEINNQKNACEKVREQLAEAEKGLQNEKEHLRVVMADLDHLQEQLPKPHLYIRMFEAHCARANCRWFLDKHTKQWRDEMLTAVANMLKLHQELRAGKYRIDKNSELIGGRATASAEALYAAVALGNKELAFELFNSIVDPTLLFDQVFNVFRVWAVGLLIAGRLPELDNLLLQHDYSTGLRGGYVTTFRGLLAGDAWRVSNGLKTIVKYEWEIWQDPKLTRGVGVVNLGATALAKLAYEANLQITLPDELVPVELVQS
ncbi:MAG: hypothetical protein JW841_15300 [Deltaproteobacteria bacterium]|nr:hypothetical protein [Deltaproteobacteria bacterium]